MPAASLLSCKPQKQFEYSYDLAATLMASAGRWPHGTFLFGMPAPLAVYVLRRKTHRQMVSWLAWLAMAFIVVAPLVSRVMPMHAPVQGMTGMASMMGSDCQHAMASDDHPATPDHPADPTDRCCYCVLLDHQSLLAAHVILHLLPASPRSFMVAALHEAEVGNTPNQDARPRGPPNLS